MLDDRIAKLSDIKKRCLRLAHAGLSSKEIALEVGRSHRTVDQYLYEASVLLDVQNRREAAQIFAEIEAAADFNGFQLKSRDVANPPGSGISSEPTGHEGAQAQRPGLPPLGGPTNELTVSQRLTAIGKIALFLTIAALTIIIVIAAALNALSR